MSRSLLATLTLFKLQYCGLHCFYVDSLFRRRPPQLPSYLTTSDLTSGTKSIPSLWRISYPPYQHPVLSCHIFLMACCSCSFRKLSGQYIFIADRLCFPVIPPAADRLCFPARLLTADRLDICHVSQHTPANRCQRLLCLLVSWRSFFVVYASGTDWLSPTHSCELVLCHSCLWASLHSCAFWSTSWMDDRVINFNIHLWYVH